MGKKVEVNVHLLDIVKKCLKVPMDAVNARVDVTPEQAQWILESCNRKNRKVQDLHVEMLRRDMEAGNWYSDVDYIGFDKKGLLVNGQHRLLALSGANVKSVPLKFDFDAEQHVSMDTKNPRSYSDQVRLAKKVGKEAMPNRYRPVVLAVLKLQHPGLVPSNSELAAVWKRHHKHLEDADNAGLFNLGTKATNVVKASMLMAYISGVDLGLLSHMAEVLRVGITKEETDIPTIRLRDALVDLRGSSKGVDDKRAKYTHHCIYLLTIGSTSNRLPSNPILRYVDVDLLKEE